MLRYSKACVGRLWNSRLALDGQKRWTSYNKAALDRAALLEQIESELGRMKAGKRVKINTESRTIKTDAGELPISPMMDPGWINKRRRPKKAEPTQISGNFRVNLSNNPYDFELVEHPDPEQTSAWFAPGPLSFERVMPRHVEGGFGSGNPVRHDQKAGSKKQLWEVPKEPTSAAQKADAQVESAEEAEAIFQAESEAGAETAAADEALGEDEFDTPQDGRDPRFRAPFVSYVLARKSVIDMIGRRKNYQARMSARSGMASLRTVNQKVFRPDMGDVLLKMLRRLAVDTLITRSDREGKKPDMFINPVKSWEEAKKHVGRGSILYIPKEDMQDVNSYATLDVEGANYASKVAVHDLRYLLGEEELERLRSKSNAFSDHNILILTHHKSLSMRKLHMLLWKLQGYLALPEVEPIEGREY
ncbi:uncharacterized protein QYS62_008735 [Fusarium acuminatum]|uniref:Uncharacterized protein n=1 Tax=Fusarium acuminatum TaxID=5515 RepID=A0ABZ2X6V7_9HYPO